MNFLEKFITIFTSVKKEENVYKLSKKSRSYGNVCMQLWNL